MGVLPVLGIVGSAMLNRHLQSAPSRGGRVMNEPGLTRPVVPCRRPARRARRAPRVLDETVLDVPDVQTGVCFILDPDSQLIELVQTPGEPSAPPPSTMPRQSRSGLWVTAPGSFTYSGSSGVRMLKRHLQHTSPGSLRGGMARISTFMFGLYSLVVTIIDFGQVE